MKWSSRLQIFFLGNWAASLLVGAGAIIKIALVCFSRSTSVFLEPDSYKYLNVANNFSSFIEFSQNQGSWDFFLISPGYPLFLKCFGESNIRLILVVQILMLAFTQIGVYSLSKNILGKRIALISLTFFVLESSSNLSSISLLSETLFTTLFTFVVIRTLRNDSSRINYKEPALLGALLGVSVLVRPIGQVILLAFLVLVARKKYRAFVITIVLASFCITSVWSFHNKINYGSFQLSGIQSFNLLYFEGVGAKSVDSNRKLSELQAEEIEKEKIKYPNLSPINDVIDYRVDRAKTLILDSKSGFVLMHLKNIPKMMVAPGSASISRISRELGLPLAFEIIFKVIGTTVGMYLLTLSMFGFVSILIRRFRKNRVEILFLSALIIISVAASTGANSYSRFRVPIVPIEILLSGFGLRTLLDLKNQMHSRQL